MTSDLAAVIENAYSVFAEHAIGSRLCVCRCPVCMTEESEHQLVTTPLRELPAIVLAEYTNSAHGWDDDRVAREMRHFLPRYLELIARYDPPDNIGLDICLRRLRDSGWKLRWPDREVDVLVRFFDAFTLASTQKLDLERWPKRWRPALDFRDVLTLAITAGDDVARLLALWDGAPDPGAALHMASLREDVLVETGRTYLYSPFLEEFTAEADAIGAFLVRPEVSIRIERAFFLTDDPRLQEILSAAV